MTDLGFYHRYSWLKVLEFAICLHFLPLHLTRKSELRKSCWEIRDSQRLWKSQISVVFALLWGVFSKLALVCEETTCSFEKVTCGLCNFVGHFSDFFPRNFVFFPRNFANIGRNWKLVGQNQCVFSFSPFFVQERGEGERDKHAFIFLEWRKMSSFLALWFNILRGENAEKMLCPQMVLISNKVGSWGSGGAEGATSDKGGVAWVSHCHCPRCGEWMLGKRLHKSRIESERGRSRYTCS